MIYFTWQYTISKQSLIFFNRERKHFNNSIIIGSCIKTRFYPENNLKIFYPVQSKCISFPGETRASNYNVLLEKLRIGIFHI